MKKTSFSILLLLASINLLGQDYTVNNAGDQGDSNPGDGVCSTALGGCTLRAALDEANNDIFISNTIDFSLASGTQINITSELLVADVGTIIDADLGGDGIPDIIIASIEPSNIRGFHITGANNIIKGFNLVNFSGPGTNAPIQINGIGASGNIIISNYIGTNLAGNDVGAGFANFRSLRIINGASNNAVGDGTIIGRNIISGNTFGIEINGSDDNKVVGNIIGLDALGGFDYGNGSIGVEIINSTGTSIGNSGDSRNFISGNSAAGIEVDNSPNTAITNNFIGTNIAGDADLGNNGEGVNILGTSNGSSIGDGTVGNGNLISGNGSQGVLISSPAVTVLGNIIGLNAAGNAAISNSNIGLDVAPGGTGVVIGNGTINGRNIISGNSSHGVRIREGSNTVQGNYIGLGTDGDQLLGNSGIGVFVTAGADNSIGGNIAGQGNVIAGNAAAIQVSAGAHFIYGNTVGLNAARTQVRANNEGIRLTGTAKGVLIGDGTVAGANYISGNTTDGIFIDGANVNTNTIQNNYIGVLGDNTSPAGNGADGIIISGDANLNSINNNIISNSGDNGIEVNGAFAPATLNNTFSQNSIFANANKGISIVSGAQGNVLAPVINTIDANVSGTSGLFADVEVFLDAGAQGEFYVGMTTADDAGLWSMPIDRGTFPAGLDNMTAIQTSLGNSSEFSNAIVLPLPLPFITTWKTDNPGTSNSNQITIPTFGAGYSYDIYWEEVGVPANNGSEPTQTGNHTITFPSVGTYFIEISGNFPRIYFANGGDKDKILSIEQWGDITWNTMSQAFYGCTNLMVLAADAPDLTGVSSLFYMFRGSTTFNESVDHWDVSTITNFGHMFRDATSFNQSLSSWDLSNVNSTDNMFDGASSFNQNIGIWNLSSATSTSSMFFNATSFNQDISGWNVSTVGDFDSMFGGATSFNQDIGNWDVSSGWMFWSMFENATAFDQNLGSWDVSNADYLDDMLNNTALSVANYDATLIGWESLPTLISSINLGAAGLFYCTGEAARTSLETTHGWTIIDAGLLCPIANTTWVYWTEETGNQINRSALDGISFEQYHNEPGFFIPRGIDIDTVNKVAYWTNNFGQIRKGNIDAAGFTGVTDFINDALDIPREMMGIALDVTGGKIYWASNYDGSLKSADLFSADPISTIQILSSGYDDIRSVAIDLINSKLYFTDNQSGTATAIIYQSDLDGGNRVEGFSMVDNTFTDLKLDVANDNIYWTTPVGVFSAKISNIAGTLTSFNVQGEAYGIDLDLVAGKIYWADKGIPSFEPARIGRANLDGTFSEILHTGSPNILEPRFIALDVPGISSGCASPPTANAGPDMDFCESDNRTIFGAIGGGATSVAWTTSGDGTFTAATSVAPSYTPGPNDIANGSVVLTITTDDPDAAGPCLAASDDMIITIERISLMDAGPDQTVCQGDPVQLAGTIIGDPVPIQWFLTGADGTFDDANSLTPVYSPGPNDIINGSFTLLLESSPPLCVEESDNITITISQPITAVNQTASLNVTETTIIDITNGATIGAGDIISTTLLTQPQKGTTIINGDGSISYTALAGTVGDDTFDYEMRNQCNLFSSAQIIITIINVPPVVDVPPSTIMAGRAVTINVLNNITDDNDNVDLSSLKITVQPLSGAPASLDASGNLTVDYTGLKFAGTDQLTIEICDLDGLCSTEVIIIEVEPPGVIVYNAVSPNGDNKHDYLEIENAEFFLGNQVKIMNRWGDIVFEINGYDNDINKFTGVANKNGSGQLPSGTYYYNIVLGDGSKAISGFFSLRQ